MAKKQKEEVAEKATEEQKVIEETTEEKIKVKKKPKTKKFEKTPEVVKVDLNKQTEKIDDIVKVDMSQPSEEEKEVVEEAKVEEVTETEESPVLEEVTNNDPNIDKVAEAIEKEVIESVERGEGIPDNVKKLMDFMEDTGGNLNDYVKLNQDYSEMDNDTLLREYYKKTKPHLSNEEVNFLMEDNFSYDEDVDEERDIKRKKLALKEQVADAKSHLDGLKSKYYEDIKAGSKLTQEQQKAIDFFNRYNKESKDKEKIQKQSKEVFLNKTNQVFNDEFKGFEYKVGDKRYRFNVKDTEKIKEEQSDINNFVKKFLNENSQMEDASGYHKSLFTAMNSDAIANHFYEQGKADALKDSIAKSKNINMDPRQSHNSEVNTGGLKFKMLNPDSDAQFKIKKRK